MDEPSVSDEESCGPQLFLEGMPSHSWPLDRLGRYVQEQHEAIVTAEYPLTLCYWRLGMALNLARKQVERGGWVDFLASWGISTTRASRACAIFRTFATESQLAGLSVEEAYQQRTRRQSASRGQASAPEQESPPPLGDVLMLVQQSMESLVDELAFATPQELLDLLALIKQLAECLRELEQQLRCRLVVG